MQDLLPLAEKIGSLLKDRSQTIVIAESSTGGLISAALLSVPGASAYFLGGEIIYTLKARRLLINLPEEAFKGMRASTEEYVRLIAESVRTRFDATWCIAESGATGPSGNRYGDAPGHTSIAVAGPASRSMTVETGIPDRVANMRRFAADALNLLARCMG